MFGNNDYGQLGLGHKNVVTKPSCVKSLKPEKTVHVTCGRAHTIVSTESGKLFAYGSNSDGQLGVGDTIDRVVPTQLLDYEGDEVQQISAGCLHTVVLTESGRIYVWGSNADGQLGLENKEESVLFPKMLPFEHRAQKISCGYYHTAIITVDGDLYTCGEGENGKLGLPDSVTDSTTPTHVLISEPVMSVACGGNHTLALTRSGKVYAFGSNSHGQLGVGTEIQQSILPAILDNLSDYKITDVFCGDNHSAFIADNSHLYMSGDGKYGKICNEDIEEKDSHIPFLVSRFNDYIVQTVACGGCHTMIVARVCSQKHELDEPRSPFNNERDSSSSSKLSHLLTNNNNKDLSECYDETSTQVEHGSIQSIDMNGNEEHTSLKSRMGNEDEKSLLSVPGQSIGHRDSNDAEVFEEILVDRSDNEDDDVAIEPEEKKQGRMKRFFSAFRRTKHSSAASSRSTKRQMSVEDMDNKESKSREMSGSSRNKTPNSEKKSKTCAVL